MKKAIYLCILTVLIGCQFDCQPKNNYTYKKGGGPYSDNGYGPHLGSLKKMPDKSPTDLGYKNVTNWLKFPPKEHPDWEFDGSVAGVGADSKGNVYISHRGEKTPQLTVWKPDGTFLRTFPGPKLVLPHFVKIDWENEDIVWWVDGGSGNRIYKMDQNGNVLLNIGDPNSGVDYLTYDGLTDVDWDSEGNLYLTDGVRGNRRVVKFDKDGKYIKQWGSEGPGLGQFNYPHGIHIDSNDRIYVCDRNNWRVQVFDKNGKYLDNWDHIGRIVDAVGDKNGNLFHSDGRNGRITKTKPDGTVIGFFEAGEEENDPGGLKNAHSISICPNGDLITGIHGGWVEYWKAPKD